MTKEELQSKIVSAISLGCDKNRVDLEKMLGRLRAYGYTITANVDEADIVIVNTCAFIECAQLEAITNIADVERLKDLGVVEKIIVTGCFPERNYNEMKANFPKIDAFLKLRENDKICEVLEDLYGVAHEKSAKNFERVLTNGLSYAYLKIADGCNNACSFCTIPRIRGRYVSYPIDDLVKEASLLAKRGIKELILVAQDTSRYGEDLYGENCLIKLCDKLSKIDGIKWIRLHYLYPEKVDDTLLSYIVKNPKMCNYIDLPLQHIDDEILKSMRRRVDEENTRQLVQKIQNEYPEIALRSTFMVGYPGESKSQFKKLCQFLQENPFDYAGFFAYSREQNTSSFYLKEQISARTKKARLKKITKLQQKIMTDKARAMIGEEVEVLVDYFDEQSGEYCGHSQKLSPTVDFDIKFVDNGNVKIGDFIKVKLTDFDGSGFKGGIL